MRQTIEGLRNRRCGMWDVGYEMGVESCGLRVAGYTCVQACQPIIRR